MKISINLTLIDQDINIEKKDYIKSFSKYKNISDPYMVNKIVSLLTEDQIYNIIYNKVLNRKENNLLYEKFIEILLKNKSHNFRITEHLSYNIEYDLIYKYSHYCVLIPKTSFSLINNGLIKDSNEWHTAIQSCLLEIGLSHNLILYGLITKEIYPEYYEKALENIIKSNHEYSAFNLLYSKKINKENDYDNFFRLADLLKNYEIKFPCKHIKSNKYYELLIKEGIILEEDLKII